MRLLLVEDEEDLSVVLAKGLRREGYAVDVVGDGGEGLTLLQTEPYDLAVLDLGLPSMDGLDIIRQIRGERPELLVLILTARGQMGDRVRGLDLGADDYLVKPFGFDELLARLRALLRRDLRARVPVLRCGDLTLDPAERAAWQSGRRLTLTQKEFAILGYLMRRPGEVVSQEELLDHVWDAQVNPLTNVVPVHINSLRRALGDSATRPRYIRTIAGAGYCHRGCPARARGTGVTRAPRFTLKARLVIWSAALMFAAAVTLALSINLGARFATVRLWVPQSCVGARACQPSPSRPSRIRVPVASPGDPLAAIGDLGTISLISLSVILALGSLATYLLADVALRPLYRVSEAAKRVDIDSLDPHLPVDGPADELNDLSSTFNAMLERLRAGIERERRFISDASHELRTPLAIMRTNLDVAIRDPQASPDDYRVACQALERSLRRLERLTEDLLALARDEPLQHTGAVVVGPLLSEVASELEALARPKAVRVSYRVDGESVVDGDEVLIRRALGNLVENAIRYNKAGGWVRVLASLEEDFVKLVVEDSGVGIPPAEQARVFDRFWRGDPSRSRGRGGSGLGLSLVAEIAQRHGGAVSVVSRPGVGSTFTLRLPARRETGVVSLVDAVG